MNTDSSENWALDGQKTIFPSTCTQPLPNSWRIVVGLGKRN